MPPAGDVIVWIVQAILSVGGVAFFGGSVWLTLTEGRS